MPLRQHAERLLKDGKAPLTQVSAVSPSALHALHDMAAVPAQASAALKLLHELQVHQVEIDLQREQCEQQCVLLEGPSRFVRMFDEAPFAYLRVQGNGKVLDANRRACAWLGRQHIDCIGALLQDSLTLATRAEVTRALTRLLNGSAQEAFDVQQLDAGLNVRVVATAPDGDASVLMAFMPLEAAAAA